MSILKRRKRREEKKGAIQESILEVKYAARFANIRDLMIRYGRPA